MTAEAANPTCGAPIGDDRLLTISDVANILGTNNVTASRIITETSHGIKIHRRLYVLESNLLSFLKDKEACNA